MSISLENIVRSGLMLFVYGWVFWYVAVNCSKAYCFYKKSSELQFSYHHEILSLKSKLSFFVKAILALSGSRPNFLKAGLHVCMVLSFMLSLPASLNLLIQVIVPRAIDFTFSPFGVLGAVLGLIACFGFGGLKYFEKNLCTWDINILGLISLVLLSLLVVEFYPIEILALFHVAVILLMLKFMFKLGHGHIVLAAWQIWRKPAFIPRSLASTNLEDEEQEEFGLGRVVHLDASSLRGIFSCTNCGRCQRACPAYQAGLGLSPYKLVTYLRESVLEQNEQKLLFTANSPLSIEHLWQCSTCRQCEAVCPMGIRHLDMIIEARKYQSLSLAQVPVSLNRVLDNLEKYGYPLGPVEVKKSTATKQVKLKVLMSAFMANQAQKNGGEASKSTFDKNSGENYGADIEDFLYILQQAGVEHELLSLKDCGDEARRLGQDYLAAQLLEQQANLSEYNVLGQDLVCGCPHTINFFRTEKNYKIRHYASLLLDLYEQGRLKPKLQPGLNIVYHDPCYLSRWAEDTISVRRLLTIFNHDISLKEAKNFALNSLCCGGGGGLVYQEGGAIMAKARLAELAASKADVIITACPVCKFMLEEVRSAQHPHVMELSAFIRRRI